MNTLAPIVRYLAINTPWLIHGGSFCLVISKESTPLNQWLGTVYQNDGRLVIYTPQHPDTATIIPLADPGAFQELCRILTEEANV